MPQEFPAYKKTMDDGRRKIHPSRHREVKKYYKEVKSTRKTAEHFGISRRLVMFILHPERLKALQDHNRATEHWKKYYDTDKRREYMRKYRAKKREVFNIPYQKINS